MGSLPNSHGRLHLKALEEENRLIYTGPSYAKKPLTLLSKKGIRKINSSFVVLFHQQAGEISLLEG